MGEERRRRMVGIWRWDRGWIGHSEEDLGCVSLVREDVLDRKTRLQPRDLETLEALNAGPK
jgi:hypothetical protein